MHKQLCLITILSTQLLHASPKPAEADVKVTHEESSPQGWLQWAGSWVGLTISRPPRQCCCSECTSNRLINKWRAAEDGDEARMCIENIAWYLTEHFWRRVYGADSSRMVLELNGTQNDLHLQLLRKILVLPPHAHEHIRTACAAHFYELMWKNNGNELTNRYFITHHAGDTSFLLPVLFSIVLDYVGAHQISLNKLQYFTSPADRSGLYFDRSHPTSLDNYRYRSNICRLRHVNELNGIESLDRCKVIDCSQDCEITHMPAMRIYNAYEAQDLDRLTIINLANNFIKKVHAISISQQMLTLTLPKLAHINLANNKIEGLDEDFYQELAACGPRAPGRKITLDLRGNPLTEKTRKRLAAFGHVTI